MTFNQKILFNQFGMNSDTAPEYNKGFPLLKNVRILGTNNGNDGAVTTTNGNTLVEYELPSASNICIGAIEDKLNQKIYGFIWNSDGKHSILEYNELTNSIMPVLIDDIAYTGTKNTILNFQYTNLITGDCVVQLNVDEGLLYWTDNWVSNDGTTYNEPKKINIQAGILFMTGDYTGQYAYPFLPKYIDRIKEPPSPPTYVWSGLFFVGIQFKAKTHTISSRQNVTSLTFVDVEFPTASPNIGGEFAVDPTNIWTVPHDGYWNVAISLGLQGQHGADTCGATVEIYNNTTTTVLGTTTLHTIDASTTNAVASINIASVLLAANDEIIVRIKIIEQVNGAGVLIGQTVDQLAAFVFYGYSLRDSSPNFLFKRLFQFQCDWGYKDKERSVLSQKSNYILPVTQLNAASDNSTGEDYVLQDNKITITVPTGGSNVRDIRIYAHETNVQASDTISDTSLVITLNKDELGIADDTFYDYIFLNDGNYLPVNLQDAIALQDFVPVREKALAFFKNRIADANVTEGQDAFEVDMRFPMSFDQTVQTNPNSFFPARQYLKSGGIYEFGQEITYGMNSKARISNVNTRVGFTTEENNGIFGTRLKIPFLTQDGYTAPHLIPNTDMEYVPTVKCLIYNRPPADMLLYNIMASKNQAIANYIQFTSNSLHYADATGAPTTPALAYYVAVYIDNIYSLTANWGYKYQNPQSRLVYDFTKGDRIRFIANRRATSQIDAFFPFNDSEITSFNSSTGELDVLMTPSIPLDLDHGSSPADFGGQVLFEIYTPAKSIENDNETMYETGNGGEIGTDANGNRVYVPNDNGLPTVNQLFDTFLVSGDLGAGVYSVTISGGNYFSVNDKVKITSALNHWSVYGIITAVSYPNLTINTNGIYGSELYGHFDDGAGTIVRASEQTLIGGDCFRRKCNMPFNITDATKADNLYQFIETNQASNMFNSPAYWFGRPNRIDNLAKRLTSGARVLYTEQLLVNSNVNGLSKIYDTNFQDYNVSFGGINYLFYQNEALQAYQQLKVLPILVMQQNMQSPNGSGVVGSSTTILAPQQKIDYYLQDFGIGDHPESWAYYGNRKYFIDVKRSAIVRLSNDGLVDISSEANMSIFMANLCTAILANPYKVNCVGVYDTRFGTYILSISPFGEGAYQNGLTIEFNEKYNQFTTTWSYVPDYFCQNGVDVVTFKDGQIWTQNTNTTQNNWFGEQYSSEIWFYINDNPENNKILQTIKQRGIYPFAVTEITNQEAQSTHLLNTNFKMKESVWYSKVYMDEKTPNIVASPLYLPNAIVAGNVMRSRWFLVKFEYSDTLYNKLFSTDITFTTSSPTIT